MIKIQDCVGILITGSAWFNIHGLVQERRNSIANALELRLSCTKPSIWIQSFVDENLI